MCEVLIERHSFFMMLPARLAWISGYKTLQSDAVLASLRDIFTPYGPQIGVSRFTFVLRGRTSVCQAPAALEQSACCLVSDFQLLCCSIVLDVLVKVERGSDFSGKSFVSVARKLHH